MACTLKLPVGIDSFEKIRRNKFYYIDKTKLIEQLVETGGEVTLFTRPRRFGKTLNMSMLKAFFETGADESLFDGLYIAQNKALCEEHMGKYPVIFLSLKSVEGLKYEDARYRITELIGIEAERFGFLEDSEYLSENEKKRYKAIIALKDGTNAMDEKVLVSSLQILSQLLYKHFGQKTVILIDEYDVPLDKAFQNGYYKEMVSLIRGLFGQALKTNEFLQFAVLTGCLRVSKESIFTGLNNFEINSIVDIAHDEQFGFTDDEVRKLLLDYDRSERYPDVKEWYDGYHFGNTDIYCPWDVINFAKKLVWDPSARPSAFWINSSGNDMVKRFVDKADQTTRDEIEKLVAGGFVEKQLRLDLTYDEIDNTIDNLWSVLFTTGYLTKAGEVRMPDSGSYAYKLVIPNKEVREVFVLQIQEWFKAVVAKDDDTMKLLSRAILDKDEKQIARQLNIVMSRMISILDTKASDDMKENFYHGLLLGLLRGSNPGWLIKSNRESGDGFSDILIKPEDPDAGIVIEVKYAKEMISLDAACVSIMKYLINPNDYLSLQRILINLIPNIGIRTIKQISSAEYLQNGLRLSDFINANFQNPNYEPFSDLISAYLSKDIIVFDIEGTGTDIFADNIIQLSAIKIRKGKKIAEFNRYLKSDKPVGDSEKVHHISDEYLQTHGENPKLVLQEFCQFIQDAIITGHNIRGYDMDILNQNLLKHNLKPVDFSNINFDDGS